MSSKKIAEILGPIINEYASTYEFDLYLYNAFVRDSQATIDELREAKIEEVWEILTPELKSLVASYIEVSIRRIEENTELK